MEQTKKHTISFIIISMLLLILGMFLAISLGAADIGISEIIHSIFNKGEELETLLIRDVRIPRALCVLFTGGILGVTGAMIQGVTRNPIAEPSLLGISQGATLVISIFYAAGITINTKNVMMASLIGAFLSGIIVIGFLKGKANNSSMSKLLLAGTSMSTFFISLTTIIGLLSNRSQFIAFWVSGGFRSVTWSDFNLIFIVSIITLIIVMILAKKINVLSLGDDVAIGLGISPEKTRFTVLIIMIPMCAAAVAVGKNIPFLGLFIPLIVRRFIGEDYRKIIPCSFLLGAVVLTFGDILARMLYTPYEVPIGIFTSLVGIPFLIIMARKERG